MRRSEVFWGFLLVVLGGLFLLRTAGFLTGDIFGWFWPLAIVAAGVWMLLGGFGPRGRTEEPDHSFSIPLQAATAASLRLNHAAGRLELGAGASPGEFLVGSSAVGMNQSTRLEGTRLFVSIDAGPSFIPFIAPHNGTWRYRLNPEVPTAISIQAGASRLDLDLTELHVTEFSFDGGASRMDLTLPARVQNTRVEIKAGAAKLQIRVPDGVAARARIQSVGSLDIDENRFPRREPELYQSADYDSAAHRADIKIDGGATAIQLF